ncbi:MAG TPA: membrane protein insertion efficiency factor YidD [Gammaproteobacteria bacterium]|nr:membrane protein insertion efficiency factor YidD [Gammaproteobacteria bacterium]
MAKFTSMLRQGLLCLALYCIRAYQYLVSPWLGYHCRFQPSCSCYAREALEHQGFWKGTYLSLRRLLRCHPWHPGGIDFVPLKK